ncbi:MAG: DNA repair protein [Alloalcanivorax venustensis]|jgi:chromosome segregation ATPase|nr:DNA repair protein [Alloalcanivorax venustensis]MBA4730742.1 DNA repair protein [Alcanivorax sp.]MCH9783040.1 DNA repair protein [Gammaproteobacteria bacterium]MEA3258636.1 DNA repair protein [Pseudomonadota bacterium]MBG13544.1 DNA repair protein [Alcanivorax sp.]MBT74258.1 DNA repair protein [Alcanivorax sp.]|tara:strand:- start:67943 stop:68635 length:693 start_codon:yes stop_codon:yes gene_type:complete
MDRNDKDRAGARWLLALALMFGLVSVPAAWAQAPESLEQRLRAELRNTTQQLRDLQSRQARLEAARAKAESQRDDALAQVEALQARLDDREGKLTAERRASQSRIAASQERAQQVRDAYDELLALAREKEAQRMTWEKQARERAAALRTCVERNEALFSAGREILDAYQNLGSGSLFRMRQPLAASARVEFENQAQAFGDRLYNNQVQVTETSSDDGEQTDQSEEARNNE